MDLLLYTPFLAKGAFVTCVVWLIAGFSSIMIGTIMGIISCRYLAYKNLSVMVRVYTFVAKGIPAYVQILIAYFVIPSMLGINIPGFITAVLALAFCSSGYVTEIIRAGINTVPRGQWDASFVLGYSLRATLARIILPQTVVNVLPSLLGELEQLLKSTSLLATIGITELTRSGMNIISRELNPIPIYLTIAGIYLIFSAILQSITIYLEKRTHGYRR